MAASLRNTRLGADRTRPTGMAAHAEIHAVGEARVRAGTRSGLRSLALSGMGLHGRVEPRQRVGRVPVSAARDVV